MVTVSDDIKPSGRTMVLEVSDSAGRRVALYKPKAQCEVDVRAGATTATRRVSLKGPVEAVAEAYAAISVIVTGTLVAVGAVGAHRPVRAVPLVPHKHWQRPGAAGAGLGLPQTGTSEPVRAFGTREFLAAGQACGPTGWLTVTSAPLDKTEACSCACRDVDAEGFGTVSSGRTGQCQQHPSKVRLLNATDADVAAVAEPRSLKSPKSPSRPRPIAPIARRPAPTHSHAHAHALPAGVLAA
jgi:hypothetical protein